MDETVLHYYLTKKLLLSLIITLLILFLLSYSASYKHFPSCLSTTDLFKSNIKITNLAFYIVLIIFVLLLFLYYCSRLHSFIDILSGFARHVFRCHHKLAYNKNIIVSVMIFSARYFVIAYYF